MVVEFCGLIDPNFLWLSPKYTIKLVKVCHAGYVPNVLIYIVSSRVHLA